MKKIFRRAAAALLSAGAALSFALPAPLSASADWKKIGYIGDLNSDGKFNVGDLVILTRFVLGSDGIPESGVYDMDGAYYLTGVRDEITSLTSDDIKSGIKYLQLADIDQDGVIDTYDLVLLRKVVIEPDANAELVYRWYTEEVVPPNYISAPIYDLYGSMPSQGDAKVAIISVDFPDCKFSYNAPTDEVERYTFGEADPSSKHFPYESIAAFYERSSKGAMKLSGKAYEYSAQQPISYYEGDIFHKEIIYEVINALDSQIDFNDFDADKDGTIDAIMIVVPESAGKDNWWPTSGVFGGDKSFKPDGLKMGHVIVGNQTIGADGDYSNYCTTYAHEMGHCMGLPDYYLYDTDDFQGMHGSAGFELMDDAAGDFGAASKLMLGWYREDQVSVFDSSQGEQSFTLYNSETSEGNCVIIPRGDLADKYRSEFFIIEYTSLDSNNMRLKDKWWMSTGSGVRIFHVEATLNDDRRYPTFLYKSGNNEATNYNMGIRFIRLVNEGNDKTDNLFRDGAAVSSSTPGYMWYDSSGGLTVDSGTSVTVSKGENDTFIVTVKAN
jgi:M6 family metalloprotease-like protein